MSGELLSLIEQSETCVVGLSASLVASCFSEALFPVYDATRNPTLQLLEGIAEMTLHYILGVELLHLLVPLQYVQWPATLLVLFTPILLPRAYRKMTAFVQQLSDTVAPVVQIPTWVDPKRRAIGRGSSNRLPDAAPFSPEYVEAWNEFTRKALGGIGALQTQVDQLARAMTQAATDSNTRKQGVREKALDRLKAFHDKYEEAVKQLRLAIGDAVSGASEWAASVLASTAGAFNFSGSAVNTQKQFTQDIALFKSALDKANAQLDVILQMEQCTAAQARNTDKSSQYLWNAQKTSCEHVYVTGPPTNDPANPEDKPKDPPVVPDPPTGKTVVYTNSYQPCTTPCSEWNKDGSNHTNRSLPPGSNAIAGSCGTYTKYSDGSEDDYGVKTCCIPNVEGKVSYKLNAAGDACDVDTVVYHG